MVSPSVIRSPVRNFKFLAEGSLGRTRNYRLREKELFALRNRFPARPSSMGGWCGFRLAVGFGPLYTTVLLVVGCPDHRLRVHRPNSMHCPVMGWCQFWDFESGLEQTGARGMQKPIRHRRSGRCIALAVRFHVDNALSLLSDLSPGYWPKPLLFQPLIILATRGHRG